MKVSGDAAKRVFRVLYVFAGAARKSDLEDCLKELQQEFNLTIECESIDLARGDSHDVLGKDLWPTKLQQIKQGYYQAVVITPPCNTHSRARHSLTPGPPPVRSRLYPYGYPWLFGVMKKKVEQANRFIEIMIEGFKEAAKAKAAYLGEHPEDLGVAASGELPATIWALPEVIALPNVTTGALFQCPFGASTSKPTRLVSNFKLREPNKLHGQHKSSTAKVFYAGWPKLDSRGCYKGPLPRKCEHKFHPKLQGQKDNGEFRTSGAAAYPPDMCAWLARNLVENFLAKFPKVPSEGEVVNVDTDFQEQEEAGKQRPLTKPFLPPPPARTASLLPRLREMDPTQTAQPRMKDPAEGKEAGEWNVWHRNWNDPANPSEAPLDPVTLQDDIGDPKGFFNERATTSHPGGRGPALITRWAGKQRDFHDGSGLASPGRWHPECRKSCEWRGWITLKETFSKLLVTYLPEYEKLVYQLALGRIKDNPFPEKLIEEARQAWAKEISKESELTMDKLLEVSPSQPFLLQALGETLRLVGDPDFEIFHRTKDSFATGVPVGYKMSLPRNPALYEEKVRWKKYDEMEEAESKDNYSTATTEILETQFEEERKAGRMEVTTYEQALKKYKHLKISAQGAIEKSDSTFRIIHDGSHDVAINPFIKIPDQMRCPNAGEGRTVMEYSSEERPGVHFGLHMDVSKAHRLFLHREQDRGLLCCRTDKKPLSPNSRIWLNKVGTFGITSASYWWSRLASGIGRLIIGMMENNWFWQLIFADDVRYQCHGPDKYLLLILSLFLWVIFGTPISWHKCAGGLEADWLGYHLDYGRFRLGISEARAQWLIRWAKRIVTEKLVLVANLSQGLGRLGFAAGALEWVKPFLGPAYAWTAAAPLGAVLPVPAAIWLTLNWIVELLENGQRTVPAKGRPRSQGELFRTDTKGEADYVVLGGYMSKGVTDLKQTPWFSLRITEQEAPWLFEKGHGSRTIGASELLATMVAVHLFCKDEETGGLQHGSMTCSGISGVTDNIGNSYVIKKLMTTKIPLCAVLMQLTSILAAKGLWLDLRWTPREDNIYADALTNEDFTHFSADRRVEIEWKDVPTEVLNKLAAALDGFVQDVETRRAQKQKANRSAGTSRKKKRIKEVWG